MRSFAGSTIVRAVISTVALVLVATMLLITQRAAAQAPAASVVGYGKTASGEVMSPNGTEHSFTGCGGERINLTVTASGEAGDAFAPRVELYDVTTDESIANAVAGAQRASITLDNIELPASGNYGILVSGRSRADRGAYALTLDLNLPAGTPPNDGLLTLNLIDGDTVNGTLAADRAEH